MDILLSVIVTVYNIKEYLDKCIESICCQTYKNLEIIIVDDGSTDGSGEICDYYALKDKRIKVLHKENGGQVSARKLGAKTATGQYVISVDGDDWIERDRFQNLVEKGLKSLPDMVHLEGYFKEYKDNSALVARSGFEYMYDEQKIQTDLMKLFVGRNIFLERKIGFSHWQWCTKRDIYYSNLIKINEKIRRIEDVITIFSCILDSKKIVCINESGYHYIQREGSINGRRSNWSENHANIYYAQMKEILGRHTISEEAMNVAVQYIYHNIFLTNYKKLYDYYTDYLFPYLPVKNGSKIIVYGAGNIGVELVNAIDTSKRYEIVAWIDKQRKSNPRSNHKIEDISVIKERAFDYIVIAILVADISTAVKKELVAKDISDKKIVLMQCTGMNMKDIDAILGKTSPYNSLHEGKLNENY